ncbi:UBX domain-containing protein 1-like [Cocos nucifera]|uniref:UBX domain-containing protein 1-like n=1 Tax=Cocos nucifera TaxID=13894 RepID=A0A8K0N9M6_COCNU|nr:UBX domain-containing protein 1-like [Cocos nucifera]
MPLVPLNITIENGKPSLIPEAVKVKAQELRENVLRKNGEEKKIEREREKERIRAGKELLEAKQILEENERRRMLALRQAEKEEEKKAREKIRQQLEKDKEERRRMLGLPPADPKAVKVTKPPPQEKNRSLPVKPATKAERIRDCLRSLKKNHKDEDVRVKRAFQTLLIYVGNVAKNPDEEKFRKIRLSNPTFQDRVGSLKGGIRFLELCGFEKLEGDEYLYLPRDKVDMVVLKTAGLELNAAITNPFFGVF